MHMAVLVGKPKAEKITSIAILTVTSPIVINIPTRDLLLIVSKGFFVLWWANLNNKTNCSSMFVNSEYCYYAVLQWQTPLRFSQLLFYCQVHARRTICLFVLSVYVCQNNEQNYFTVETLPICDTSPIWKINQLFWGTSWICDLLTSGCALGE